MSLVQLKNVVVKAALNCLAKALIIATARVNYDHNYQLYGHGKGLKKPGEDVLKTTGVDLANGGV